MIAAPNDTLSRAATEVAAFLRDSLEGEAMDAGFDAGEFSGPAWDDLRDERLEEIARQHGFQDYKSLCDEIERRTTDHWTYKNLPLP